MSLICREGMLARLFVIVGGLLVLVLCAALVVPPFINWTSYRADFEREASVIMGRKVTVRGEATARLLPFPSVTFSDVSVAGGPDGQPAMIVDTFSMDAELAPFLRGEVLIFDMRLVRPKATIDIGDDGTVDWVVRPSSPFNAKQIAIEKLTVTDGEIEVRHEAGGRNHLISEINSTISAKSLFGPWRVDGSLLFDGTRTRLSASTGLVGDNGQMRLRLKVDPDAYPLTIETDGNTRIDKGAIVYSGQFKIAGDDKNSAMLRGNDGETVKVSAAKPEPGYRLTGSFQLDHRKLDVDAFRFETGPVDNPYTADGTASADLGQSPHFSIIATGAQVQFDEAVGAKAGKGLTLEQRIDSLKAVLVQMPKPTIPGIVEVKLPAVVAGDTTIRDVHLSAEPADGGWAVKSLAATLPGRAKLEARGKLSVENQFGFAGSLLLAVGQPSGFAAWLSKDVDEAIRRLPSAGFNANVEMTDQSQTFSDLELILGQARFKGRIVANEPQDARPSVEMQLEGGNLDVDGLAAFASLFVSDKGANRFLDRDLDFKIKAGPVDAGGFTAETIDTALRLRDGLLEIDKLSIGGLAGASISATGRIKDFPDSPTGNLDASIVAVDLAPLIDMAATHYPGSALLRGLSARAHAYSGLFEDARIDLVASAAENSDGSTGVALSAQGNAGASAISASFSAQGDRDDIANAPLTLTFSAKNDDATSLLALAGLPALPLGMVGAGAADVSAKGTLGGGLAAVFDLAGADFKAHFDGTVADTSQGVAAKGKIRLDASDIEPWMMTTGVGLPGMGLGTALTLDAEADYANGLLVLSNLASTVNEAAISGDINADIKDGKPHLTGALALDELDLDPVAVMLFGDGAFASVPKGWPTSPFAKSASVPFSAEVDLNTATLAAGQFATAYDATLSFKLDREGMRVSGLKAKLFGGEVSGLFDLKNNDGTGFLSGQMELANADLSAALPDAGISGRSDFSTTVSTSGKSVDAMISALSGSGTASLKGMSIANLNADAFAAFIARADAIGRDIDAAKTAAFAPTIAGSGHFAARDTDVAFAIANGTLRAPPITLEGAAANISVDLGADLAASTVSARGTITYQAGDEALVGSEPALNFTVEGRLGETQRIFDSEPLAQFLTQRALEKEQLRVEAMQAVLLEKQRLRRETRYYAALQDERERAAEEQRQKEEEARLRAEAEAKAAAEARIIQEAEAKAKAEAEAKARAEAAAEAAARAEQERLKAEAEAKAAAEAEAQAQAEAAAEEAARVEQERLKAEQALKEAEQEKAQRAADQNAIEPLPGVERAPLAPAINPSPQTEPVPKPGPEPFSIDNLLRSLGGG